MCNQEEKCVDDVCDIKKERRKILLELPHIKISCFCAGLCVICMIISAVLDCKAMNWMSSLFLSIGTSLITGIVVCWITNLRSNAKIETENTITRIEKILECARKIKQLEHKYKLAKAYRVTEQECKKDFEILREYAETYMCKVLLLEVYLLIDLEKDDLIGILEFREEYDKYNEFYNSIETNMEVKSQPSIKDVFICAVRLNKLITPSYNCLGNLLVNYRKQKIVLDTKPF